MGGGVGGEVTGTVQGTATCGGKRGIFRLGIEGNPIKPPDPQSGFQTAVCPLFSLIPPTYGWTAPLSCGPASQNVLATESAQPLSRPIPSFSGWPRPLGMAPPFCSIPFPIKLLLGLRPQMPVPLRTGQANTRMAPPLVQSRSSPSRLWTTTPVAWTHPSPVTTPPLVWPTNPPPVSPRCPGSGEWGRGSVGEVLVRMRLFRLLVRQLRGRRGKGPDPAVAQ